MSTKATYYFLKNKVNSSLIVPSSKLDKTIKAVINTYSNGDKKYKKEIIEYLNILRVIYYIKRLKYKNKVLYMQTIGKTLYSLREYVILTHSNR